MKHFFAISLLLSIIFLAGSFSQNPEVSERKGKGKAKICKRPTGKDGQTAMCNKGKWVVQKNPPTKDILQEIKDTVDENQILLQGLSNNTSTCPPKGCPPGWDLGPDKSPTCYKVFMQNVTWFEGMVLCKNEQADLATVENKDVNDFVYNLAKGTGVSTDLGARLQLLLGGYQSREISNSETWNWLSGEEWGTTFWEPNKEPSNTVGCENCLSMKMYRNGLWNDITCNTYTFPYVCSKQI